MKLVFHVLMFQFILYFPLLSVLPNLTVTYKVNAKSTYNSPQILYKNDLIKVKCSMTRSNIVIIYLWGRRLTTLRNGVEEPASGRLAPAWPKLCTQKG